MYLKSLELFGFKSFAQKTVLNFHPGVTAIVGPNGCGKSNVLDSMRWVLGEQSAKALRGGEMSDVIFSGTDSRTALGMAEVSLTFAECEKDLGVEWNEVCITRRVFRDGQSEYLLNKTPCRLRDIHNLFMDTGIGRSAYSIMEQGKIDQILSSRPEDRRAIFEEAAGITKFKSQKKEAMRKLEATEANLIRLTDIIKEVKRQIGSLQRQAGKARRYQTLISDLKTFETHLSRHQFDTLNASLASALAEIERLRKSQDEQELEIETQEAQVSGSRRGLDEMEQSLSAARQLVQEFKNQIDNAGNRIASNRERISEFGSLMERYQFDIAAAEEKLRIQESQIQNTDLEIEQIASTLKFEQERLEEKVNAAAAARAQRIETESELQAVSNSIMKIENRLSSLRGEISSVINVRDGSEARLSILEQEIRQITESLERVNLQHSEVTAQAEQGTASLSAQQEQVRTLEEQLRAVQSGLSEVERRLSVEQRTLAEKESKLEVLRQLNEEGEGFAEGTQAVLRGLDNPDFFRPAILGALATHIEVETEFVPAIEAALGQNLQAIVMKDSMIAESVIRTLASQKLGRASLALRDCGLRRHDSAEGNGFIPDGAIAWAVDKVKASTPEIASIVSSLLCGCVIVPDIETALRISNTPHAAFRIPQSLVTLTGEVLTADGILIGGQAGETGSSVLIRKNQIAQLEAGAETARENISAISVQCAEAASQLEVAQSALAEAREEAQCTNLSVSTLRGQLALLDREVRETTGKQETLLWELGNIEQRHAEAVEKLRGLETDLAGAGVNLGELQARQIDLQSQLETHRSFESSVSSDLNELRIRVATENQRHNSLNNQRQPMAARLQEIHDLIEQRRRDIENYRLKSETLSEESERIGSEVEVTRAKAAESEAEVAKLLEERAAMSAAVESLESTLRILRRQLSECHDQRSQQEVKQTQIQLRMENLAEHVNRRYQIDIREFRPDSYSLLCCLRELNKKAKKNAEVQDNAETPEGVEVAATAAVEAGAEENAVPVPEAKQIEDSGEQRIDWQQVETLVRELDQRLESMGPINIEAIQEYDELEQRYNFLEQQNTDLNNSKAELLDVISKINQTTRVLFAETFEQVRQNFTEMFVELFGGGMANLVLLDENDPLESGIDIIAKPPGKQLKSISLLSGGEKTMTAVALLFSIYMVKPSPFCVLDEMDAPLDESNINRFIKILDRFVQQSQFVVITHNKRTIAKADVLYGVTMEEHGVSKLVGVKFSKREGSNQSSDIIGTMNPTTVPSIAESFGKTDELNSEKSA